MRLIFYSMTFLIASAYAKPIKVPCERYSETEQARIDNKRYHPGHYPFISHFTFRNACDIVIDDFIEWFDPDVVKRGDSIYLNIWYLQWFVEKVHDRIKYPYVLVTCDVGDYLPTYEARKLIYDPKCAAWFGRNMIFSYHPKLIQIPMGQDLGLFWLDMGAEKLLEACSHKQTVLKQHLLYMNHYPRPWGDREKIVTLFEQAPYCLTRNHSDKKYVHVSLDQYYQDMLSSRFVLSPFGLETDCVRTWEALALGCIPIMEHTFIDPLFEGMPVVLVHDWEDIDESFLQESYARLKDIPISERIYFDYWDKKIKETQNRIRNHDMPFSYPDACYFDAMDLSDLSSVLEEYGSNEKGKTHLFYRGCLSAVRALQLAVEVPCISTFCLHDEWLDRGLWDNLEYYMNDPTLMVMKNKVALAHNEELFSLVLNAHSHKGSAVFLDLAYYRHSLYWDINNHSRLRHSLKRDIHNVIRQLGSGALLCGNMSHDNYVSQVLNQFSQSTGIAVETKGNFWFLVIPE